MNEIPAPAQANPDLLRRIPLTARSVLDVGCSTGALGAALRAVNPRVRLFGVEVEMAAAQQAALHYDEIVSADIELDPMPFDVPGGLDCIAYGDVLEHLKDPWGLLRRHAAILAPGGMIVICVPNVEHWSFAARLLAGGWDYEPSGLFDKTHLRWFSAATMHRSLTEAGLIPIDVSPRVFESERARRFAQLIAPALDALSVDATDYLRRAAPLQYVWRALRNPPPPTLRISATQLRPVGGVTDVRIDDPLRALAATPGVSLTLGGQAPVLQPADTPGPHLLVLHRPILAGAEAVASLRQLLQRNTLIVTEFDDHPDFLEGMRDEGQLAFAGVHAVQTSTPALAEVLRARNPEVAVFPNAIRSLPPIANFRPDQPTTLFFGALNRGEDWAPLMPVLNEAASRHDEALRFSVVHDRAFFDALDTPHKVFTPTCDYDTYMALLGGCEISFMPLADTAFNRAKSDLKFIEAAACRAVALASRTVYAATVADGETGALFGNADELRERLDGLLGAPGFARGIGDAARAYVARHRMLAYQVEPRLAWYRSLLARHAALTAALEERLARYG